MFVFALQPRGCYRTILVLILRAPVEKGQITWIRESAQVSVIGDFSTSVKDSNHIPDQEN